MAAMKTSLMLRVAFFGFAAGSAILAYEPVRWLIGTWRDQSYQSSGAVYLVVLAAVVLWSLTSARTGTERPSHGLALILLFVAAVLRLVSQLAAVNIVGGAALALDVFALLTCLDVARRVRPVSPFWVSALFLFTLPFERIAQRIVGYPMQEVSAFGACHLLSPFFDDLACEGVRLAVAGRDVLVDLPCSGTTSLMIVLAIIVTLNAVLRPSLPRALLIAALSVALAVCGNALRIALLAVGLVYEDRTGIDVMAQPFHDLIGYAALVVALAPVLRFYTVSPLPKADAPTVGKTSDRTRRPAAVPAMAAMAVAFVAAASVIVALPRQALDVSGAIARAPLPIMLNGVIGTGEPLMPVEQAYFEQFGGTAQKAVYGPMALTLVQTTSPLRHLHDPSDCLRGLGYRVAFIGTRFEPAPTAIYRAEDRTGQVWKVSVTFTAANGFATSSVAEAIWHWLKVPGQEWRSIQRIMPWNADGLTQQEFEMAAIAAFDLTPRTDN